MRRNREQKQFKQQIIKVVSLKMILYSERKKLTQPTLSTYNSIKIDVIEFL